LLIQRDDIADEMFFSIVFIFSSQIKSSANLSLYLFP
jgi:hypothetical protein